ncbi:MAG: hypothetical protein ACT4OX_06345 [Actinomycetota bacterium]
MSKPRSPARRVTGYATVAFVAATPPVGWASRNEVDGGFAVLGMATFTCWSLAPLAAAMIAPHLRPASWQRNVELVASMLGIAELALAFFFTVSSIVSLAG